MFCMRRLIMVTGLLVTLGMSSVKAGFQSDTQLQSGYKINTLTGRASMVGSFSFASITEPIEAIRLNTWINIAGSPPSVLDSPTLYFTKYSATNTISSFVNSDTFATSLRITNNLSPTIGVEEIDPGWVALTSMESTKLASLINSDPLGRVSVFMFSSAFRDFDTPRSTTNFTFSPLTGFTFQTTYYNATLSIQTVPEPTSMIVFGGLAVGMIFVKRRFASKSFQSKGSQS